jgi:hypothetical protein
MADELITLKTSTGKVIGTVHRSEWDQASKADQEAFLAQYEDKPTERLRAAAQGLTFGASDEIAAAAQNPISAFNSIMGWDGGKPYEDTLKSERGKLDQYRKDYPYSSLGWEVGGAALPIAASIVAAPFTGGTSAEAAAAPTAGRLASVIGAGLRGAKAGAIGGAAYGFNSGEGGFKARAIRAGVDAGLGAAGGGAIGAAASTAGNVILKPAIDWIRNKSGDRMAGVVSAEIQRLAQEGGLTADEVIDGVANGRLMAENKTLTTMIRKFYSEGGKAASVIRNRLDTRPAETRAVAQDTMQSHLADAGNPLANKRASDEATRLAERDAYKGAFDQMPQVPDNIVSKLQMVARDAPEALTAAAKAAKLKYGVNPFFTEKDGQIIFTRTPSLAEAESTYRALRDLSGQAYKAGQGDIGEGYGLYRDMMKGELDATSGALAQARSDAAIVRHANDFFKLGQMAANKSPDELEVIMKQISERDAALGTDEGIKAFRAGLMTNLRGQMSRPSSAPGVIRNLANPETGPGTALRYALPDGAEPGVQQALDVARDAQAAQSNIIGGSQTAQTMMNQRGIGDVANMASDAGAALTGNPMAIMRLVTSIIGKNAPKLSEAQRLEVARIVVSEDPALVERALKDNTLTGVLEKKIVQAIDMVGKVGARSAPIVLDRGLLANKR